MNPLRTLLLTLAITTSGACAAQDTQGDDQTQIAALLDRYETALNASDVDAVVELYAHDGVFMPSSAPTAEGADQVSASYEFVFSTIQLAIRFSIDEIEVHGDVAFARTGSTETTPSGTISTPNEATIQGNKNRRLGRNLISPLLRVIITSPPREMISTGISILPARSGPLF